MNIRTLDWIAESQENKTKQTEENNVLCHRLLCVPNSGTSSSVSYSIVQWFTIWKVLSPALCCLSLTNIVRDRGQAIFGTSGETEAQKYVSSPKLHG